jgi:AraC-like DNA-binding protein
MPVVVPQQRNDHNRIRIYALEKDTNPTCETKMTDSRRTGDDLETKPGLPSVRAKQFAGCFPNRRLLVTNAFYLSFLSRQTDALTIPKTAPPNMKKPNRTYEPHLTMREISLRPGTEWMPRLAGWTLIYVSDGAGYCLQPELNQELETGAVLLITGATPGVIRASNLSALSLHSFSVMPARLVGLLTLSEQTFFQTAALRKDFSLIIIPPQQPVAMRMKELCGTGKQGGLLFRLKLFQLFVEMFSKELDQSPDKRTATDARERLRAFLDETPSSELLEMSFNELAQMTSCTSRHLSRIFRELVGKSFRDKRAEIRLARARELLATSNSKVVDVALESGYKSLSLFNLMFSRRFGTSPSKWRQKHGSRPTIGKAIQKPSPAAPGFFR